MGLLCYARNDEKKYNNLRINFLDCLFEIFLEVFYKG